MKGKCQSAGVVCVLALVFLLASVLVRGEAQAFETRYGKVEVRSTTQYRVQWSDDPNELLADDDSDQDIYEIIGVDAELPKDVKFSFLGKYAKDLDGTVEGSLFQDYLDVSSSDRQRFDAYYAYFEKEDLLPGYDLRLGRQYSYGAETVNFDGAWVRAKGVYKDWIDLEVFGGAIVQMYSDLNQDGVAGANLQMHPTRDLSVYLESVFYKESSYDAAVYWRPYEFLKTHSEISFINNHTRDFTIDVSTECPRFGTQVELNLYRRFEIDNSVQDDFIYDYTFSIAEGLKEDIKRFYLAQERAYYEFTLSVSQPVPHEEGMTVFARYTMRQLAHDYDEDLYNTDFQRWTLGLRLNEWRFLHNTELNVGFSKWYEDREHYYESDSTSVYADIAYFLGEKWTLGGGFYYKDEDVNSMIEGEASAHYYGSVKYALDKDKWAELKYEYEDDDYYEEFGISSINALTATVHVRF